jgi:transcription elongation factor Elf1
MSIYIDKKYVSLLAPRLKQFKQRGEFLWNFRCPVCGDSHKNSVKARGYIYKRKLNFGFMCHNCGASMSLREFLKDIDPMLYREYQMEKFREDNPKEKELTAEDFKTKPVFDTYTKDVESAGAVRIKVFPPDFFARKYLEERQIDLIDLYYTSDFGDFVRRLVPHYEKKLYKEERIIIPFYDKDGNLLGVQGRAVGKSDLKYITIKMDESLPKIYGWNKVDGSKTITVVEGPLDSRFLFNAIATMDAALYHAPSIVGLDLDYVFVYDNECRNKQIVSNMRKTIDRGYKVCVWPNTIKEKDINDMVLAGMAPAVIQHLIDRNTYSGLEATMKLNEWSRI